MTYHNPALLKESIEGLNINPSGIYVDATFGGGGHSKEIIKHLGKTGRLIAFDRDEDALKNSIEDKRFLLLHNDYKFLKNFLKYYNAFPVDGILADLGISSHQIDTPERGFSIRQNSVIDLRMDRRMEKSANDILNQYDEVKLKDVFKNYGELDGSGRIAAEIVTQRKLKKINTVDDLKEVVKSFMPRNEENKFMAKLFQALRIEVNGELNSFKEFLLQSLDVLKPGGRLVVISYHSLEDRLVKNIMKTGNFEGILEKDLIYGNIKTPFKIINKKLIVPSEKEIEEKIPEMPEKPAETAKPKQQGKESKLGKAFMSVVDGTILTRDNVLRLLPFIFFLTLMMIVYIANSYYAEKTVLKTEKVRRQIKELELEYISVKSDYMIASKQSAVASRLDSMNSGIKESVVPPKKIFFKKDTTSKKTNGR